ncbi:MULTISPECIES: transcription elongation factor GreA [Thioalkalivibrio]|uniref:Transcription elongation factor GreA n=1 Tax=Thioalkalivibrio halophilus TaxID=252474 RepID=A0A1V3A0Z3_9GAMM|nr:MULTISPECIES: transcription elongation factor GreA [Thioalkalivibrio]OOC11014.1 transcription elongation factor GreA [Thioalkalivibrio halophilus]PYG02643.1 transcription elongation factor GreA [Thioalkalivibrio sp. ALE21]
MKKTPLTLNGAEKMKEELRRLKAEDRPKVVNAIAEAREHGDLKENAEYHAAREQQSFIEGRIRELEATLSNAEIIDVTALPQTGKVVFGTTVVLEATEDGREVTYKIVGDDEADIKQNMISVSSPIARALIGKEEGDIVTVQAPGGETEYEILEVRYVN